MSISKLKSKKLNNKGFSLLELIIIIAIMGIISGLVVVGVNVLGSGDSKKMAKSLYSDINLLKTQTLTVSGDWYLILKYEDNKYKIETCKDTYVYDADGNVTSTNTEVVSTHYGGHKVVCKVFIEDGDTSRAYLIDNNNSLKISFRKDNGAFYKVELLRKGAGSPIDYYGKNEAGGSNSELKGKIVLTAPGVSSESEITLVYKTGRITTKN